MLGFKWNAAHPGERIQCGLALDAQFHPKAQGGDIHRISPPGPGPLPAMQIGFVAQHRGANQLRQVRGIGWVDLPAIAQHVSFR